jgi:glucose/arabinose dehydrogenase
MPNSFCYRMCLSVVSSIALLTLPGVAQQSQVPQPGIAQVELGPGPYTFDTAEQHKLRVTVVARNVVHPFSIAFLPNGDALLVERGSGLKIIHDATGVRPAVDAEPVRGVPEIPYVGGAGLQDILLHPDFSSNRLVYFTYNKVEMGDKEQKPKLAIALARGKFDGKKITEVQELFTGEWQDTASGARLAFGKDGMLYMTTGGPFGQKSLDLSSVYGKMIRLREDGSAPSDNPFVGKPGDRPEVFAYGFRDQLGLVLHQATGAILATDHGPNGGDEVNRILPGRDYGWPKYSFGRQYDGPRVSETPLGPGVEQPLMLWIPSIAPSGLEVYTGDRFPAWKGNLFIGSARRGEIPRTGGLERVVVNKDLEELRRETLLTELHLRIRFVRQGPDGLLYVLAEQNGGDIARAPAADGAVLRLEPVQ